jgi:hypothetical protein
MPKIFKFYLQISLRCGLIAHCTLLFLKTHSNLLSILGKALRNFFVTFQNSQIQAKYTLQNKKELTKHLEYTLEALKSSLNIQKSTQKHSKALIKYSLSLLFPINSELFTVISNQNHVL